MALLDEEIRSLLRCAFGGGDTPEVPIMDPAPFHGLSEAALLARLAVVSDAHAAAALDPDCLGWSE